MKDHPLTGAVIRRARGFDLKLDSRKQILHCDLGAEPTPEFEVSLSPTPPRNPGNSFVSAALLAFKADRFDAGLRAAGALLIQQGAGRLIGKASFVGQLLRRLSATQSSLAASIAERLLAAAALSGAENLPRPRDPSAMGRLKALIEQARSIAPLGFHAWSPMLGTLARHDFLLASPYQGDALRLLSGLIHGEQELHSAYRALCKLRRKMTSTQPEPNLLALLKSLDGDETCDEDSLALFPTWPTRQAALFRRLTGEANAPANIGVSGELTRRIMAHEIDLTPTDHSGWYDYQAWALEAMVASDRMPEATRLHFSDRYREFLFETFAALLDGSRPLQTHQAEGALPSGEMGAGTDGVFDVMPALSAEPLPEHYLRMAFAYRFVRRSLDEALGDGALAPVRRLTPEGPVGTPLGDELRFMETLFYGAYVTARRQLGFVPDISLPLGSGRGGEADAGHFLAWIQQLDRDPDLGRDTRRLIPMRHDRKRQQFTALAMLGWTSRPLHVKFSRAPDFMVLDERGQAIQGAAFNVRFLPARFVLAYPVVAEVKVKRFPNPAEFRQLCDQHRQPRAILEHLK